MTLRTPAECAQVGKHKDPQDACLAVVVESYKAWLATEARTDDITVIVVEFELGEGLTCAERRSSRTLRSAVAANHHMFIANLAGFGIRLLTTRAWDEQLRGGSHLTDQVVI